MTSKVITTLYPDKNDKTIIAHSYQDCQEILDANAQIRGEAQKYEWGRHIATIPNNLLHQWLIEEEIRGNHYRNLYDRRFNNEVVAKKLRDPNYKYLLV